MNEFIKKYMLEILTLVTISILGFFGRSILKLIKNGYYKFKNKKNKKKINDLLIILYKKKGSADLSFFGKKVDLNEIEIINKMKKAKDQGLVINTPDFNKHYDWNLTQKGEIYVENLLNKSS